MQDLVSAIVNSQIGVVGALFISVIVGYVVLRFVADSFKWIVVAGLLVWFLISNLGLFGGAATPPGDAGNAIRVAEIGFEAQDGYQQCLGQWIKAEPANRPLAAVSQSCAVQAYAQVRACQKEVEGRFWILDKLHHCQGKAAPGWETCARSALLSQSANGARAAAECERLRQIGFMQKVAGMIANLTDKTPSQPTYDTECLRGIFNANLRSMPQLHCEQKTPIPEWQQCVIQSITTGLGAAGASAVAGCAAPK